MMRFIAAGLLVVFCTGCASSAPAQKKEEAAKPVGNGSPRCDAIFDKLRPSLEKQWEASLPMDQFDRLRDKMPELKKEFSRDCAGSLNDDDLKCAEGDNSAALAKCKEQPEEAQEPCRNDVGQLRYNPLMCTGLAGVLDRAGSSWLKSAGLNK